jgi:polyisoprenoid-binding protein YceI
MKITNYAIAAILTMMSLSVNAQKLSVDTQKSTINWIGKKIGGQHEGFIKILKGTFELKNGKMVTGEFVVDMNTISCSDIKDAGYNEKLVGHLKSDDFFGVEIFPTAILTITKASKFSKGKSTVTGTISIKGKTQPISFVLNKTGNTYSANLAIDRSKFDVRYGSTSFFDSLGDKAIDDIFTLDVKLVTASK